MPILTDCLAEYDRLRASIIEWSCPVLSFGDSNRAAFATVGLNPSNLEFVDSDGIELNGTLRRFPTLGSLGLKSWSEAANAELLSVLDSCADYFRGNPYDAWFGRLETLISGTGATYYGLSANTCHLDLTPFATPRKWGLLMREEKEELLGLGAKVLAEVIKESPVKAIYLNGQSVIAELERLTNSSFDRAHMANWDLPRATGSPVQGTAINGFISNLCGIDLEREIEVFGVNHNVQSSYGVSTQAMHSIRNWLANRFEI